MVDRTQGHTQNSDFVQKVDYKPELAWKHQVSQEPSDLRSEKEIGIEIETSTEYCRKSTLKQ